jgi:hypothetical protein
MLVRREQVTACTWQVTSWNLYGKTNKMSLFHGFHGPSRGHQYSIVGILLASPSTFFAIQRPLIVIICDIT